MYYVITVLMQYTEGSKLLVNTLETITLHYLSLNRDGSYHENIKTKKKKRKFLETVILHSCAHMNHFHIV